MARFAELSSYIFLLCFLLMPNNLVSAYNLDTYNFIRYAGKRGTMFGFSVTLHQEYSRSWVIVGAPKTDTSGIQPGVSNGGAVFKCDILADNACIIVPFDTAGNTYNDYGDKIETKSDQWFGATVASGGVNGPLVACAPRYVYHTSQPRKAERIEPVGNCFLAKDNFKFFSQFSPCRTIYWGYHRQGSCQAGFSAAVSKRGDRMYVGAPGSWYWQGQVYSINTADVFPYRPPKYGEFGEGGQLYSYSLTDPTNRVYKTQESSVAEDDSYLGYSSVSGDFNGDGQEGVAVGMPRSAGLLGKVVMMSWNMTMQFNITGDQIGSYFGYALCAVDLNNDNLMDLVVGAPMHVEPNNEGKYDVGRIHIFYQYANKTFGYRHIRDGFKSKGRFGLSLSSLGDVNQDGYKDFVVGAPYDGPAERGAVYIFHGSAKGALLKYSQVIYAENVAHTVLSTFGFSVGGGVDLDGNRYPDLVVGAYNSNHAIVFKSRPVVMMVHASTTFASKEKLISLDGDRKCNISNVMRPCTHILTCLQYSGVNLPSYIDIVTNWVLDTKLSHGQRLLFSANNNHTLVVPMILDYNVRSCHRETVYIVDKIRDKLTPIEVEMNYTLYSKISYDNYTRVKDADLEAILDQNKETTQRDSINIRKNCRQNNICIPNLELKIKTIEKYLLSTKEKLEINVFITNHGDDAFEAEFYLHIPPGLTLFKYDKKASHVLCNKEAVEKNNTLRCDIGNPMHKGEKIYFVVILQLSETRIGKGSSYMFHMGVNSTNPESGTLSDNIIKKEIPIWVQTNITMAGVSKEQVVHYNSLDYKQYKDCKHENDLGPQVVHVYGMVNNGPSTIENSVMFLIWANETNEGEPLMYLLHDPETEGSIKCESSDYTNVHNVIVDEQARARSYLQKEKKNNTAGSSSGLIHVVDGGGSVTGSGSMKTTSNTTVTVIGITDSFSNFSASSNFTYSAGKVVTEEEKRRFLEAEEKQDSKGDSSLDNIRRIQEQSGRTINVHGGHMGSGGSGGAHSTYQNHSYSYGNMGANQGQSGRTVNVQGGNMGSGGAHSTYQNHSFSFGNTEGNQAQAGRTVNLQGGSIGSGGFPSTFQNHSYYESHSSQNGGPVHVTSRNSSTIVNPGRNVHKFESSTEYYGAMNISSGSRQGTGSFVSQPGSYSQSNRNTNYQNRDGRLQYGNYPNVDLDVSQDINRQRTQVRPVVSQTDARHVTHQANGINIGSDIDFGKVAATGGLQTTAFDVEMLNRVNTENEMRSRGQSSVGSGSSQQSDTDGRGGYSYHRTSSSSGNVGQNQGYGGRSQSYETHRTYQGRPTPHYPGGQPIATDHYVDPSDINHQRNSNLEPVENKFKHYDRFRREVDPEQYPELQSLLKCNNTKCAIMRCEVGQIQANHSAWVALRMRLVAKTMEKISGNSPLVLSSMGITKVTRLPYIGKPSELTIATQEVFVTATPEPTPKPDVVPMWVVILSACAGILILLLIALLLYQVGFFNRNRPSDSSERQPLNRNGNYHGDEHL